MEIITPQQVISELNRLQTLSEKGVQTLADAELKLAEAENAFEKAFAHAILKHDGGTAQTKEALAKLDTADEKFAMQLARIERDRVKNKLKQISEACVSVSVISRQVELQFR